MSERPHGALTLDQAIAVAKAKGIIYKAYDGHHMPYGAFRPIVKIKVSEIRYDTFIENDERMITLWHWFNDGRTTLGYLFDNYFHALAYVMKLKNTKR